MLYGPCIPRVLIRRPVVLASAAISIMALDPSTKLHSIFGFMPLASASARQLSGSAVGENALFLPLPATTTSKPRSRE